MRGGRLAEPERVERFRPIAVDKNIGLGNEALEPRTIGRFP